MSLLQATSVSISYGLKPVFNNLDIEVNEGECWGILGANGAGKTTLLHVLAGLHEADEGKVLLDGRPVAAYPRKALARQLGILFQDNIDSFPVTVLETALTGRYPHLPFWAMNTAEDISLCMDALEKVSLSGQANRLVQTLSGGERRRLALATLMVQSPRLWLLDEPTNHLDLHFQISLLELIVEKAANLPGAVLMVLHDVNLLTRFCSHAFLMIDADNRISGKISDVISGDALEALYRHPIRSVNEDGKTLFYPA